MNWTLIVAAASVFIVIVTQIATTSFLYGRLTEKVRVNSDRTIDHGRRITNMETVLSGTGGHGERLTALEAWRIESKGKGHA